MSDVECCRIFNRMQNCRKPPNPTIRGLRIVIQSVTLIQAAISPCVRSLTTTALPNDEPAAVGAEVQQHSHRDLIEGILFVL